jgi:hypothetical protein
MKNFKLLISFLKQDVNVIHSRQRRRRQQNWRCDGLSESLRSYPSLALPALRHDTWNIFLFFSLLFNFSWSYFMLIRRSNFSSPTLTSSLILPPTPHGFYDFLVFFSLRLYLSHFLLPNNDFFYLCHKIINQM